LKPHFGGGRAYHDYGNGFYTTEDVEAAKEWACQGRNNLSFVYTFELDTNDLSVLDLGMDNTLAWVSVLMAHRRGKRIRGAALERCNRMIEQYGVDVGAYDITRGYRANDSYFQFTADFVTDTITIETLMKSIVVGDLGTEGCIKSEKAYQQRGGCKGRIELRGEDYEHYHNSYMAKDSDARKLADDYLNEPQNGRLLSDILKGGAT
jgi:hypothetical protein